MTFSSFARAVAARSAAAVAAFFLLLAQCQAAPAEFSRGPAPAWVEAIAPQAKFIPPADQVDDGTYYVLIDYQSRLEAGSRTSYRHHVAQAINATGVDSLATIEIEFEPSYQKLVLHELAVIRNGRRLPQLATADVQVLQRETDLERRILDGTKSATILLSDVRVGDVIEYAYSLQGMNPALAGQQAGGFPLQWEVPVHELRLRLVYPEGLKLDVVPVNSSLQPAITVQDGWRDMHWRRDNLPPLGIENDAPAWSDLYPRIQWSTFADWNAVARWADGLYRGAAASSAPLRAEIARIAKENAGAEARLLAALRFVQGEVRYTGIEVGAGSYKPRDPDVVLARRFGDCKDKSLLLVAMLAALDIEAKPALVDSDRLVESAVHLPNQAYFDHVIVRARLAGNDYWLDPTRPTQVAPLDALYQPDFGLALVIDPATRALVRMPQSQGIKRELQATFDARAGLAKPAKFTMRTIAYGGSAEVLRQDLAGASRDDLSKQYLKYYATYYDGIRSTSPLEVSDDAERNVLTVTEHYEIPDFWPHSESEHRKVASLHMPDTLSLLVRPTSVERKSPIALSHPQQTRLVTVVELPEDWPIEKAQGVVEDAHFRFEYEIGGTATRQVFTQTYRTLADEVDPAAVATYAANVDRAREEVGYEYYYNDQAESPVALSGLERVNWMLALIAAMCFLLSIWAARRVYRFDPVPPPVAPGERLEGIGGWLLVPALGALLSPLIPLAEMYMGLEAFAHPTWETLTHPGGASYHVAWAPLLLFELATQVATLVLSLLVLVLFFRKRSSLPVLFVFQMVLGYLLSALDLACIEWLDVPGLANERSDYLQLQTKILPLLLWSAYMLRSRRVRSTFVNRLARTPAASASPPVEEPAVALDAAAGR